MSPLSRRIASPNPNPNRNRSLDRWLGIGMLEYWNTGILEYWKDWASNPPQLPIIPRPPVRRSLLNVRCSPIRPVEPSPSSLSLFPSPLGDASKSDFTQRGGQNPSGRLWRAGHTNGTDGQEQVSRSRGNPPLHTDPSAYVPFGFSAAGDGRPPGACANPSVVPVHHAGGRPSPAGETRTNPEATPRDPAPPAWPARDRTRPVQSLPSREEQAPAARPLGTEPG